MRGKQIMTVTGPVNANLLGTVYSHEHLIVQPQIPDEKYIAYTLSDENASAKEVQLFANAGGKTIVEMTPINYGRDVLAYQRIAEKTGIYVICCTGFHKELFMPSWFKEKKSSQIYDEVLNEVVSKMKTLGKPFVIVLNTAYPKKEETIQMVEEMSLKYDESVYACNVINMEEADVDQIFTLALSEFEIETLTYKLPEILDVLGNDIKLKSDLNEIIMSKDLMARKVKDVSKITDKIKSIEDIEDASLDLDGGNVTVNIIIKNDYVKTLINNLCDFEVNTKADLIKALYNGHRALILEKQYGKALESCNETGYGVAIPTVENMKMLPPTVIKQAGRYGVKVEAIAPSIHFIKVDIKSSFAPIIGSLEQSKSLIDSLDGDDSKIWDKEIFGRKISEIVNDGVKQKVYALPETSKEKLKDVMNKLLNSNRNSLIAIVL